MDSNGKISILGASPEIFEIRNHRFEIYKRSKLRGIHHPVANKKFTQFAQLFLRQSDTIDQNTDLLEEEFAGYREYGKLKKHWTKPLNRNACVILTGMDVPVKHQAGLNLQTPERDLPLKAPKVQSLRSCVMENMKAICSTWNLFVIFCGRQLAITLKHLNRTAVIKIHTQKDID